MEIEWALVVFTALTGCGGLMAACIAIDLFLGKTKNSNKLACIVDIIILGVGGCTSVLHLQHPTRILNALSQPTSGIFVEAVLVGLCALSIFILFIMMVRNASATAQKIVGVIGAALGLLLAFMAGHSYMMGSIPAWCTYLLPTGYLLTSVPAGVAAYIVVLALKHEDTDTLAFYGKVLLCGGILALVGAAAYGISASAAQVAPWWIASALIGGVVSGACGFAIMKKPENALTYGVIALACALIGSLIYRIYMWLSGVAAVNFFGNM